MLYISELFPRVTLFLIFFKVFQTGIVQAFYLEKIDVITYSCYRCAKNQNKLCHSLGARVQVTMGNNHKQVRYFLIASSLCRHNKKQTIKNITTKLKNNKNKTNNKYNIWIEKTKPPETDCFENITLWRRWLSALDTRNRIQYTLLGSKFSYCTLWTGAKQWSGNC